MDTARRNDRQNRTTPPSTAQPGASAPKKRIRAQRRQRRRQHQQPSYYITNLPVWLQQPSPIPQPIYVPVQSNVNQYGLSASASFIHLYANPYIYGKLWCRLHPLPIHWTHPFFIPFVFDNTCCSMWVGIWFVYKSILSSIENDPNSR